MFGASLRVVGGCWCSIFVSHTLLCAGTAGEAVKECPTEAIRSLAAFWVWGGPQHSSVLLGSGDFLGWTSGPRLLHFVWLPCESAARASTDGHARGSRQGPSIMGNDWGRSWSEPPPSLLFAGEPTVPTQDEAAKAGKRRVQRSFRFGFQAMSCVRKVGALARRVSKPQPKKPPSPYSQHSNAALRLQGQRSRAQKATGTQDPTNHGFWNPACLGPQP